jgi:lipoteichoic acid synthase
MKKLFSNKLSFFFLAVVFVWAKTYISYLWEFNLGVKGGLQQFLLFLNPFSAAIVFFGLALFAKGRVSAIMILILDVVMTLILYANILFYRFFDDFLTFSNFIQRDNLSNMQDGVFDIMNVDDVIYFLDLFILIAILIWRPEIKAFKMKKRFASLVIASGVALFMINLGLAEKDRPELLTRTFDRNYIVKYLGPYNFTIYNGIETAKSESQRAYATSDDLTSVKNYTSAHYAEPNPEYFGVAKGKNIIKIHLESFQSFLIDYKLNGQEVTPFLNKLAHGEEDMMYFDNFFHQTGQGKTSDTELTLDNSLFGLPEGAAFMTKGQNTYQSLPSILNQKEGYTSAVFHGDYKSFWNRDEIYKRFGIDKFFDASYYDMSQNNLINLGLKDKEFFNESMPMLKSLKQPFYAHLLTLTNHYPFILDERDASLAKGTTGDSTVDGYFQTARYLDESLEQFINDLKASGLYDDSIIMIYGDHNGISENHNRAMAEVQGTEITPYQNAQNQRVPLMLHIPGKKGGVNHTFGGTVDVMPTLLHLQGIDQKNYINFGTDLFSKQHDQTVSFRNGDFVTPAYTSVDNIVYDTKTGKELEPTEETKNIKTRVEQQLKLSDQVLYQDLLRFHDLKDFKKVEPSLYHYGNTENESNH